MEVEKLLSPIYRFVRRRMSGNVQRVETPPVDIRDYRSESSLPIPETPFGKSLRRSSLSQGTGEDIPLKPEDVQSEHGNLRLVKSRSSSVNNSSGPSMPKRGA